jgi:hypothetical protein
VTKQLALLAILLATSGSGHTDPQRIERDARHVDSVLRAAKSYAKWGRVDEHPNVAPALCRAPLPQDYGAPAHARLSQSNDAPHGKKLYYLYASERGRYLNKESDLPVGFTVVKESFVATPTRDAPAHEPETNPDVPYGAVPPPITTVVDDDGKRLKLGARTDLFVMVKVGDAPGADDGWVFGTVAPDGTVTSAGRVASCMGCHDESATREKLFGLRPAAKP